MKKASNPSVGELTSSLLKDMERLGYSNFCLGSTRLLSRQLSVFMEQNGMETYDEPAGAMFQDDYCQHHKGNRQLIGVKLFIARLNAALNGEGFAQRRKLATPTALPESLDKLLLNYKAHCAGRGNCPETIRRNESCCRSFLKLLADGGICSSVGITGSAVSAAVLRITGSRDFPIIRAFLRFLAENGHTVEDCSFLVPYVRPPQPIPSVYSIEEIQRIEAQVGNDAAKGTTSIGKRDYAMLLLATRLGLRPCDIVSLTFSGLDFRSETIRITQKKTDVPLELPLLPAVRDALLDYIKNARGGRASQYVFLSMQPPYSHVSARTFSCAVRDAISAAGIDRNGRGVCARAMRSSLASSMINDGVPYEAARRTLGHRGKDAIRHYARLDVAQLKLYALAPPAATGRFAEIISGRCPVK